MDSVDLEPGRVQFDNGGPFTSQADKNCTWTILALAMRTSHYIADERKKGTI